MVKQIIKIVALVFLVSQVALVSNVCAADLDTSDLPTVTTKIIQKIKKPVLFNSGEPGFDANTTKSPMFILTEGQRYNVVPNVEIVDLKGDPLDINKLPIPCDARLFYQKLKLDDQSFIWAELNIFEPNLALPIQIGG